MDDHYHQLISAGSRLTYQICVALAALLGGWIIRRDSLHWDLPPTSRYSILGVAVLGSLVGCALPAFFAGGTIGEITVLATMITPKTVLGGLLFGFIFVAIYKLSIGNTYNTTDAFARGGVLMMAIGRIGCIAQHCCFGCEVHPSLGIDFGDGVYRFPVQVVEASCLFILFIVICIFHHQQKFKGRLLFVVFLTYGLLRFSLEFLREPIADMFLGIGFYQWIALLLASIGYIQLRKRRLPQADLSIKQEALA